MKHATALQNIVQLLQVEPRFYVHFGSWWWGLKRILRREGFGPENLSLLGPYEDRDERVAEMLDGLTDEEVLRRALETQAWNARYNRGNPHVYWPDGDPLTLVDQDCP